MSVTRKPTAWLNYRGDITASFDDQPGPFGPNTLGEVLWPVTADYDPETDSTRVGFSLIAPAVEVSA